ncbi:sigma-70 family RNA polymerase sigma factor [Paenibacillus tritici]|uniref:Sigma-70 family RNA polymerase sigma factor n=2 Tax=Paenibacillus tritici TaxID=1873425 RepID=A0ABX2DJV9_9BACL|nr:sigma-70 family RNA polymerase sigma factor [Paenibacillus tritici]NQX44904.1 sigma-70 family RNA polymerase sigma factor [Paenibacillus tritici]
MLQWIEEAQKGNAEAFRELSRHVRGMAYVVAYDMLGDVQLAEDAVQEAFLEAYMNLGSLQEPAAFPGWFKTIVVRQCHRQLRRERLALLPMEAAAHVAESTPGVAEIAERKEWTRVLHSSVAELSAKLRVPLQLFYFYGYSLQEISVYLGIPPGTLKKRLHDGRRKLKGAFPVADLAAAFHLLQEGGQRMLHIVNGDSVGDKLKQGIVQGDVLVWREIYSAGPIFIDLSREQERRLRAEVLEATLGIPAAEYMTGCAEQERILGGFHGYDEVVLWFEHDLFDQSMLAYLLHWFKGRKLGRTKLSLLCIGEFPGIEPFHGLGQLTKDQLSTLSGTWQNLGKKELQLGSLLWEAYASADPGKLAALLEERRDELGEGALSFAYDAFKAHLSRLPSVENGLGIVEQTTLQAVADGVDTPLKVFRRVTDELHRLGMGDTEYWKVLRTLTAGGHPLLAIDGTAEVTDYREVPEFLSRPVMLTPLGGQVLAGNADRVKVQGVDEWYGGLHMQGHEASWRWDSTAGRPVHDQTSTQTE